LPLRSRRHVIIDAEHLVAALVKEGTVIRDDRDGFKLMLDLTKHQKAAAVEALQAIVSRLKE